jgi:hypothetical protein
MAIIDNLKKWVGLSNKTRNITINEKAPIGGYDSLEVPPKNDMFKAYIPNFLYKPPFGYPRQDLDVFHVKQLAQTPYVFGVIKAIKDRISAIDWSIELKKGLEMTPKREKKREELHSYFENPNGNYDSFNDIQRALIDDILTTDAGVIVKVFDANKKYSQMFPRAGETFLKNPDIHGYMGGRDDFIAPTQIDFTKDTPGTRAIYTQEYADKAAYFQYGWTPGSLPVPFGRREIMYFCLNPRTDSVYGRSAVQVLYETILTLLYGGRYNLDSYINNNVPQGMVQLLGADDTQIKAFRQRLNSKMLEQDEFDNYRNKGFYVPIVNTEAKYIPWQISSKDMEVLEKQKWYQKLVWQCFGLNASEMGETEDSNKATDVGQARIIRKRAIQPILKLLEYGWNTQLMPEIDDTGEFEFCYNNYDIEEDFRKNELYEKKLQYMTINEIRELEELEPVEGGDDLKSNAPSPFGGGFDYPENNKPGKQDDEDSNKDEKQEMSAKSWGAGLQADKKVKIQESKLEKELVGFYKKLEQQIKEASKDIE